MKKRLYFLVVLFFVFTILVKLNVEEPQNYNLVHNYNIIDVAKNFTEAQIKQDSDSINKLSKMKFSPGSILMDLDYIRYQDYKTEDFSFKQVNDNEVYVFVPKGDPYSLIFIKEGDKYYVSDIGKTKEQEEKKAEEYKEMERSFTNIDEELRQKIKEQMKNDSLQIIGRWADTAIGNSQKIQLYITNIDEKGNVVAEADLNPIPGSKEDYTIYGTMQMEGKYMVSLSNNEEIHRLLKLHEVKINPPLLDRFEIIAEIDKKNFDAKLIHGEVNIENSSGKMKSRIYIQKLNN